MLQQTVILHKENRSPGVLIVKFWHFVDKSIGTYFKGPNTIEPNVAKSLTKGLRHKSLFIYVYITI